MLPAPAGGGRRTPLSPRWPSWWCMRWCRASPVEEGQASCNLTACLLKRNNRGARGINHLEFRCDDSLLILSLDQCTNIVYLDGFPSPHTWSFDVMVLIVMRCKIWGVGMMMKLISLSTLPQEGDRPNMSIPPREVLINMLVIAILLCSSSTLRYKYMHSLATCSPRISTSNKQLILTICLFNRPCVI